MKKSILYILSAVGVAIVTIVACKKTDYTFGKIVTPANVAITTSVQGADATHPAGDGSGNVTITVTASNALAFKIYFGNGDSVLSNTGTVTYKYTQLDTNTYTIAVNAIGTGGAISTTTVQVKVLYTFQIPVDILTALTKNSSAVWMIYKDTVGHFGVGPLNTFSPDYYKAGPNEKPPCAYDDQITFTKVGANGISMNVNNQGESFLIAASTAFYGQSGPDNCYPISTGGTKTLSFGAANTGSSSANSTGIIFTVPGNGIVNFGTGGSTYEILSLSNGVMNIRNVGIDGNAWYQILKMQ
ncbi:MAG TPA: PKD domain-containing protein [Puia sp.]|nr:PKD domain-containing protein [Puia sp.]